MGRNKSTAARSKRARGASSNRRRLRFPSLAKEERRLLAVFQRRAKLRIEQAVDRVMTQYIDRALGRGGSGPDAQVLMDVVDRLIPAAPQTIILQKAETPGKKTT